LINLGLGSESNITYHNAKQLNFVAAIQLMSINLSLYQL